MAKKCVWTDTDNQIMVKELVRLKTAGQQADSGWKKDAWVSVAAVLKQEGVNKGGEKTWAKCQDHFGNFKSSFKDVLILSRKSGFGWDDASKMVVATEAVWSNELERNPKYKFWKTHPFPLFNDMIYLVEGVMATGAGAFHPGSQSTSVSLSRNSSISSANTTPTNEQEALGEGDDTSSQGNEAIGNSTSVTQNMDDNELRQGGLNSTEKTIDITSSPPQPPRETRKRQRADSDSPNTREITSSARRSASGRIIRNSDATMDMANAMRTLAGAMATEPSTPQRRREAIKLLEEDAEFSDDEEIKILQLFARKKSVADSYVAIGKKERRIKFIRAELAEVYNY